MAGRTFAKAIVAVLYFTGASASPFSRRQTLDLASLNKQAIANAYKVLDGTLSDGLTNRPATCNKNTVAVRKE